jgi:hypothetical protein
MIENRTGRIGFTNILRIAPLIVVALVGMGIVWWITRSGPGMSGDSVRYFMGAKNILAGHGYARVSGGDTLRPITDFPPLYSLVLAGIGSFGLDLVGTARWVNILLLGFNIVMVWAIIYRFAGSAGLSYLAAVFFTVNLSVLKYHSWVFTEPLYLSVSLSCIFLLLSFLRGHRYSLLILAAIAAGLAGITRFIGLSLIPACCGLLLIARYARLRRRILDGLIFSAIALVPFVLWLIRNSFLGDTALNRTVLYHPMSVELIKGYFLFFGDWIQVHRLFPGEFRSILAVIIAVAGPSAYIFFRMRRKPREQSPSDLLIGLLLLYGVCYLLILYLNSTFLDASTTPYAPERYLVVIYPILIMLILITYFDVIKQMKRDTLPRILLLALAGLIFTLQVQATWETLERDDIPLGYTEFIAENDELVDAIKEISDTRILYSNNPELTYAISGHGAYILPYSYNTYTDSENPNFLQDVAFLKANLVKGALIIHYGEKDEDQVELYRMLDLDLVESISGTEILRGK